ncbi:hypothetical protein GCM10025857_14770 [Alicyclobacillus contaminans]|uniref:phage tail tape measure protein n=1 Tax=Alicyclobacillus contaminans TaxID=392016 RepID=UPI000426B551|nr:phage tail tape measure protein [Alicyclobacillus contaminans]GMA50120.1 hypothetical protein GCM10025857_14770 [Alicyclobacillus contaminans]
MADETQSGVVNKVAARLTIDISDWQAQLKLAQDAYDQFNSNLKQAGNEFQNAFRAPQNGADMYIQQANGAVLNLRNAIKDLNTQFKEGSISAKDLLEQLQGLRQTYAPALDPSTSVGFINDQALRNAIASAETQLSKYYDFQMQTEIDMKNRKMAADQEYIDWWEKALQKQEADYYASVDRQVQQVKMLHDLQLQSAQESFAQLASIYEQDYERFEADINKKMQLLKTMYAYEKEAAAQESAASSMVNKGAPATFLSGSTSSHSSGFSISPEEMAKDMLMFGAFSTLFESVKQGIIDVENSAAGLQQVFGDQADTQQKLNEITNQFIEIAKEYGTTVQDVTDAGKLWARQYKDVDTALTLTRNSTLLSIVDNLNVADANRAVESSLQALGMKITDANDAYTKSMKIIDSWTAVSHGVSVSTQDLTDGFERAAASAKQVGLNVDQLSALVAAGVRNSGRTGKSLAPYAA